MNGAILTKWDADVVGEAPPIGAFVSGDGTQIVRSKTPSKIERAFRLLFKDQTWTLNFDASREKGCAEIWEMKEGQPAKLIYQRKD